MVGRHCVFAETQQHSRKINDYPDRSVSLSCGAIAFINGKHNHLLPLMNLCPHFGQGLHLPHSLNISLFLRRGIPQPAEMQVSPQQELEVVAGGCHNFVLDSLLRSPVCQSFERLQQETQLRLTSS
jgi:hypothetical protein